mmetsp:Transcript_4728/g.12206  ORF Transcript_4728/g.12206 Transcript_4728/m.12206 type:complete len:324 (+) Transcript_4728:1-972(+)
MRTFNEPCGDAQRSLTGTAVECGGACVLERFQDSLLEELKRELPLVKAKHLDRMVRTAMLRRECRELPNIRASIPLQPSVPHPLASKPKSNAASSALQPRNKGDRSKGAQAPPHELASPQPELPDGGSVQSNNSVESIKQATHSLVQKCVDATIGSSDLSPTVTFKAGPRFSMCIEPENSELPLHRTGWVHSRAKVPLYAGEPRPSPHPPSEDGLAHLLVEMACQVFGWSLVDVEKKLCIFAQDGDVIAFNRGGVIFCNALFFRILEHELHREDAESFWFVTLCHELAHNWSGAHDLKHEQAMEALLTTFQPALFATRQSRWT